MKVLYLHSNKPDYLAETLFHGLRSLLGKDCVDVPRYDGLYAPLTEAIRAKVRGYGFTVYGLLREIPELSDRRYYWQIELSTYDLIVIADIWSQWELLNSISKVVEAKKIVVLDGSDHPAFFPFASIYWWLKNYPWAFLTPTLHHKYFKRELCGEGANYGLDRYLPKLLRQGLKLHQNAIPISFSIPEEKIHQGHPLNKIKDFSSHIVDSEVSNHLAHTSNKYLFTTEAEYYQDLQQARFGITTKRAGWDCLRHYELAANQCVLCFRDLDLKPNTCAPHGLNSSNCIIYHSYDELQSKIVSLTSDKYQELQLQTARWISDNTTLVRAKEFLSVCFNI